MKLISTILLASTAAGLKQRAAPMKALQVRGGGMVEKSTALTVTKVVFGLYGAQMLLVPDFVMTQNFKMKMNKETAFITRISGLGWLAFLKCLGGMDEDDAFTTSFVVSTIANILKSFGKQRAEFYARMEEVGAWVKFKKFPSDISKRP